MPTAKSRLNLVLWTVAVLAVLWVGVGDRVLMHLAYAVERGRIQATSEELAQLQAELPEVYAVSRAFKLVARIARPGVVHIRVSGGDHPTVSDDKIEDRIREHLKGFLDQQQTEPLDPEQQEKLNERREQIEHWLRRMRPPPGSGSGIILDRDGHILTNHHVAGGRADITVILHDDREYQAKLIGTDPKTDLAVVKIDAPDLYPLTFGDSDQLEVGDWVIAVGSPFGLLQTVTHGIVSAKGRTRVPGVAIDYQDFIQTDAAINPGNSGGPLLNLRGEVVGVNTAIATHGEGVNAGIAFTIPSNLAVKIAHQLKTSGAVTRGWLGISLTAVQQEDVEIFGLPGSDGVFVEGVLDGSPAEEAGLQVEDVIIRIDGVPITGRDQLRALVADLTPGQVGRFRIVRDREQRDVRVRLGLQPEDLRVAAIARATNARDVPRLGLEMRTFRPGMPQQYRLPYAPTARGVIVWARPTGDNPPDVALGELVVACNGKPVESVRQLNIVLKRVPADENVRLEILEPVGDRRVIIVRPPFER